MSDERPNDYTPPTYYQCPVCECGFDTKPIGACPACKSPVSAEPVKGKK